VPSCAVVIPVRIRHHDKLLLILSKNSVASDWVQTEVDKTLHLERQRKAANVLFPTRLDATSAAGEIQTSTRRALECLLCDLRANDETDGSVSPTQPGKRD
jgi:hypothetical protein